MKRSRDEVFMSSQLKGSAIPSPTQPSMSTGRSAQMLKTTDALSYLKVVKEKFQDRVDMYNEFLDVMKQFKSQRIDTPGVILKVKELFEGDQDLILGFNAFLPNGYEITLPSEDEPFLKKKPVDFDEAMGFVSKIKTRFQGDHVYGAFLDILNTYRKNNMSITEVYQEVSVLFQEHADLLVEFTHFLPYTSGAASFRYAQSGRKHILQQNSGGSPVTTTTDLEQKPTAGEQYVNRSDSEQWRLGKKEHEKREGRDKTECSYDDNLDCQRKSDPSDQFYKGPEDAVSIFCRKVKERLKDNEDFKKFSNCFRSYRSKFVTLPQFQMLVASLLGSYPDLKEQCEELITHAGSLQNSKHNFRSLKVDDREMNEQNKEERNKHKDNRESDRAFSKDVQGQKLSTTREKFMAKPIHELDLSDCEQCTPSYRLLPKNYPVPPVSCRTKIGSEVLNDDWVSVTSGSEDYSFKHMRKNQYEESLFRCEDDRFELDMLLESVNATTKCVEDLLDSMNAHTNKTYDSFQIEDHLSAVNLRCIERLYGDHGLDVRDVLRKNAPLALPVILTRLKQKQEEWARCRSDFNKVWAEIYAKNYHKSLDHRSFYFKQQDTKNLSVKAFLAEIREISEKDQNEEEKILSVGGGYKQPIKPHMKFEYLDSGIQEDLYQLMQYACGEVCTPDQRDKVMKIWTMFLERIFRIPSCRSLEDVKDTVTNDREERLAKTHADDRVENGDSPSSDNAACENDISCNATQNGFMQTEAQECDDETKGVGKSEREEGELTPSKHHEENVSEAFAESTGMANADDEVAESAKGSSDSEHGYKLADVSATDSADREEHDEDEDINENGDKDENDETVAFSDHLLRTVKPLSVKLHSALPPKEKNSEIFYGSDSFYLLFRLHQILYERMHSAKLHSSSSENRWRVLNDSNAADSYARFKDALRSLLDGSSDNAKFEDDCRTIIGAHSYILFSLDKLIHKLVKQLQTIANEETENKLMQLYAYERSRTPAKFSDAIYHENARFLLPEDNLYRIECVASPTRLSIQLVKNDHDKPEETSIYMDPAFAAYLNNELLSVAQERKGRHHIFLRRNKRKCYTQDKITDISRAMEELVNHNGLEIKVASNTLKAAYVRGTEDFLYRLSRRRKTLYSNGGSSGSTRRVGRRMSRLILS